MAQRVNPSTAHRMTGALARVKNREFDEKDMRILLIDLRPFLDRGSLIRELANFVAHPEKRNRGLIAGGLNLQSWKLRRAVVPDPRPLSIRTLDCGTYEKMRLGTGQLPPETWTEALGITPDKADQIIRDAYQKISGGWELKGALPRVRFDEVVQVFRTVLRNIHVPRPLSGSAVVPELAQSIKSVLGQYAGEDDLNAFVEQRVEVMICLMSVIQGVPLEFDGGLRGYLVWSGFNLSEDGHPFDELSLLAVCEGPEFVAFAFPFATAEVPGSAYGVVESRPGIQKHYAAQRDKQGRLTLLYTGESLPFGR